MTNLLTTYDAARYLGVSPGTVANWRSRGQGPVFVRVGVGAVRYALADLDEFIAQRRQAPEQRNDK